jgi:hypothetical protein
MLKKARCKVILLHKQTDINHVKKKIRQEEKKKTGKKCITMLRVKSLDYFLTSIMINFDVSK